MRIAPTSLKAKARAAASGSAAPSAKFIGRRAPGLQPAKPRFILLALLFAECHYASDCSLWRDRVTFRPLQDRVLIRRIEEEEKTKGGIIIPDTAKEKPMEGEVLAAGPGTRGEDGKLHPLDVKVGDLVLFGKWSGTEIKIDGEDLVVMKESDIMGVVERTA
jgi:chaperonin GroES